MIDSNVCKHTFEKISDCDNVQDFGSGNVIEKSVTQHHRDSSTSSEVFKNYSVYRVTCSDSIPVCKVQKGHLDVNTSLSDYGSLPNEPKFWMNQIFCTNEYSKFFWDKLFTQENSMLIHKYKHASVTAVSKKTHTGKSLIFWVLLSDPCSYRSVRLGHSLYIFLFGDYRHTSSFADISGRTTENRTDQNWLMIGAIQELRIF